MCKLKDWFAAIPKQLRGHVVTFKPDDQGPSLMAIALRCFKQGHSTDEQYFAPNETRVMLARELINAGVNYSMMTVQDLYLLVHSAAFVCRFTVC